MKKRTGYNKLVRDNILEIIADNHQEYTYHIVTDDEYKMKLLEKLQEEVQEFIEAKNMEEMSDIFEVIEHIIIAFNLNKKDILEIKNKKAETRGKFNKKIILESVYEKSNK